MSWAKLDDQFFDHPKARAAGKDGRALFVAALCWCAANLTDGRIATDDLDLVAAKAGVKPATIRTLCSERVGLAHETDGGWMVHDYLDWNPSSAEVRDRRAKRAEAGRRGGRKSKPPGSNPEAKPEANASASAQANVEANGKRNRTPSPSPSPSPTKVVSPSGREATGPDQTTTTEDDPRIAIAQARAARIGRTNPSPAWLRSVAASIDRRAATELAAGGMRPAAIDIALDPFAAAIGLPTGDTHVGTPTRTGHVEQTRPALTPIAELDLEPDQPCDPDDARQHLAAVRAALTGDQP